MINNYSEVQEGLNRARNFVVSGGKQILSGNLDERHSVSSSPGATALASLALLTMGRGFEKAQKASVSWLLQNQREGGWGKYPGASPDEEITQVARAVLEGSRGGLIGRLTLLSQARQFSKLILNLGEGVAPGLKGPTVEEIQLPNILEVKVLEKLPQYGRPVVVAASLLAAESEQRGIEKGVNYLWETQGEDGSWAEDIVATSLAIMALLRHDRSSGRAELGARWLVSRQYSDGSWPAFDQLKNWAMGWMASILGETKRHNEDLAFLEQVGNWLTKAQNADGSFGSSPPYTHPDLDDTAVALLGMKVLNCRNEKSALLLKRLQNPDGSWGTFPDFTGLPPKTECRFPIYIVSNDVTIHVLEALKYGVPSSDPVLSKGLTWLFGQQKESGEISSMWFEKPIYSTAQMLELLNKWNIRHERWGMAGRIIRARHLAWNYIVKAQNEDGSWGNSSAETALSMAALLRNPGKNMKELLAKGARALLAGQREDGSFVPAYQGIYAKGWNYEEPLAVTLTAIRAMERYLFLK